MKGIFFLLFLFVIPNFLIGQTVISGKILDESQEAVIGANIYIEGTYDGSFSEEGGRFSFESEAQGIVVLIVSYIGYEDYRLEKEVSELTALDILLKSNVNELAAVEINAGTFKAGDNSKVSVLNPLDIVTTAGSNGDVIAALQTLPGNQANPEDGRLFVRGGDSRESNIYINGLRVFSPYTRTIGGSPSRGRYSPFIFKGVSFSTGGYSAAFGQSLSAVLDMNTIDQPELTESNISLMTVGAGLGHTQVWDKQSISVSGSYTNLGAYNWLVPGRVDWIKPFEGFSGEAVYRYKTKNGLWKSYVAGDSGGFSLFSKNLDSQEKEKIHIRNSNIYMNHTFFSTINDKTSIFAGLSMGSNADRFRLDELDPIERGLNGWHARLGMKKILKDDFILNMGIDHLFQKDEIRSDIFRDTPTGKIDVSRGISAAFMESDYFFSKSLAVKLGLRTEYNHLSEELSLNPRLTLAQKLGKEGQFSLAYGRFNQEVDPDLLLYNQNLIQERAEHFLVNYSLKTEKSIVRLEGYYKNYLDLVKFENTELAPINLNNDGSGYAYGLDFFWRARGLIKNVDFWISYGYLQHERNYRNFLSQATPSFSTTHNLSLVGKKFISDLRSQVSVTYSMASGRPYENPNTEGFLNERSKFYNNISLSWAYLISQQKILFISASNIFRFRNEFGYRYVNMPNEQGFYRGEVIRPNDDQFFFVGFFITLSPDKMKNQLDNL